MISISIYLAFRANRNGLPRSSRVYFLLPNMVVRMALPIFLSRPLRVVGIPVALAKSRFSLETPRARFQEKLSPGIFIV